MPNAPVFLPPLRFPLAPARPRPFHRKPSARENRLPKMPEQHSSGPCRLILLSSKPVMA